MRKRVSRRRWIARIRQGKAVPAHVILTHGLRKRFQFRWAAYSGEYYVRVSPHAP